jgi:hypothetical protein
MPKPTEEERKAHQNAAAVKRSHEEARQTAVRDVADRNRKAHDKAVISRKKRDALKESLKDGLEF